MVCLALMNKHVSRVHQVSRTNVAVTNIVNRTDYVMRMAIDAVNVQIDGEKEHYKCVGRGFSIETELDQFIHRVSSQETIAIEEETEAASGSRKASKYTPYLTLSHWALKDMGFGDNDLHDCDATFLHEIREEWKTDPTHEHLRDWADSKIDLEECGIRHANQAETTSETMKQGRIIDNPDPEGEFKYDPDFDKNYTIAIKDEDEDDDENEGAATSLQGILRKFMVKIPNKTDVYDKTCHVGGSEEWEGQEKDLVVVEEAGSMNRMELAQVTKTFVPMIIPGDPKQLLPTVMTGREEHKCGDPELDGKPMNYFSREGKGAFLDAFMLNGHPCYHLKRQLRMAKGLLDCIFEVHYDNLDSAL